MKRGRNIFTKSKLSQGTIVSVILIVLIVIASVVIIWNVVLPLMTRSSEQAEGGIITTQFEIKEARLLANGSVTVQVRNGAGERKLTELVFRFYDANKETYNVDITANLPEELETKTFEFDETELPIEFTEIEKISVIPVFGKNAGSEVFEPEEGIKKDSDGNRMIYVSEDLYLPKKASQNLVSYWDFDGNAEDKIGENDGTGFGVTFIDDLKRGEVVKLDGDDDYVKFPQSSSLNIEGDISISFWVYHNQNPESGKHPLIHKGNHYAITINGSGAISWAESGLPYWCFACFGYYGNLPLNSWHHIMVSKSGSTDTIYLDGQPIISKSFGGSLIQDDSITHFGCYAGNSGGTVCNPLSTSLRFNGSIDDLMIFNVSLDLREIGLIYNTQKKE